MKHRVEQGGKKFKVTLPDAVPDGQPFPLSVDGKDHVATWQRAFGILVLQDEGGVERMLRVRSRTVARYDGDAETRVTSEVYVGAGMQALEALVAHDMPGQEGRAQTASKGQVVRSQITGKVLKVLVEAGAVVVTGQALLIIEAMKMENRVFAATAGTVTALGVKEGDAVQTGKEMLRITP